MRKLFVCVILFVVLIPAFSFAVTGNSPFWGEWIGEEHHTMQKYDSELHYLFIHENSPCTYYKMNMRHGGILATPSVEIETMYDSNWEIVDDHLRIPTSPIEYIEVFYDKDNDTLYTTEWPKLTFVRIP